MSRARPAKRFRARTYKRKPRTYKRYIPRRYGKKMRLRGRKLNYKNGVLSNSRIVKAPWVYSVTGSFPTLTNTNIFIPFTDGDLRINCIIDPLAKSGGSPASWYQFLSRLYTKNEVIGARIVCTWRQLNTQTTAAGTYNVWPTYKVGVKQLTESSLTTTDASWCDYVSDPDAKLKSLHLNNEGTASATIVTYYNPRKWFSKDKRTENVADFGALPDNVIYQLPFYQKEDYVGAALGLTFTFEYSVSILFVIRVSELNDMQDLDDDMQIKQENIV